MKNFLTRLDGSVDLYLAPKAPAGKESNWIPTDAKGRFEALVCFYGPEMHTQHNQVRTRPTNSERSQLYE